MCLGLRPVTDLRESTHDTNSVLRPVARESCEPNGTATRTPVDRLLAGSIALAAAAGHILPVAAFLDRWEALVNTLTVVLACGVLLFAPSMTFGLALVITVVTTADCCVRIAGSTASRFPDVA